MNRRVLIVQHGEKERTAGDPGLTAQGRHQAETVGAHLHATESPTVLWSSPLRRAVETATPIAAAFGLALPTDARLRERSNWDGSIPFEAFIDDWERSTADRDHQPRVGDSSNGAAARFLAALDDLAASIDDGATAVVVAHGGVTTDALRTIVGDARLAELAPDLLSVGVPSAAITTLLRSADSWSLVAPPSTRHLEPDRLR